MSGIKWMAPEFRHYQKDIGWYGLSLLLAIVIFAIALWQKNLLFGIFIIIAEVMILTWSRRLPKDMAFKLDEKGLEIDGNKFYPYENFGEFAIRSLDQQKDRLTEIILRKKSRFSPDLRVLVSTSEAEKIKDYLRKFLPEFEYEESLIDHLSKLLRF